MKKIINSTIIKNKKISQNIYELKVELPLDYPTSKPGQFVNIYLNNSSKILPRPISIYDHNNGVLDLAYAMVGDGTEELASYIEGTQIKISTPLGNGFTLPSKKVVQTANSLLIGGGMGLAPLHYSGKQIKSQNPDTKITTVLGFPDFPFLYADIDGYSNELVLTSDNGHEKCIRGNVSTPLEKMNHEKVDFILACGPKPMLKALTQFFKIKDINDFQISLEERMGCGFGACVGCSIKIEDIETGKISNKKVCKDGPVFNGNEVVWDE